MREAVDYNTPMGRFVARRNGPPERYAMAIDNTVL